MTTQESEAPKQRATTPLIKKERAMTASPVDAGRNGSMKTRFGQVRMVALTIGAIALTMVGVLGAQASSVGSARHAVRHDAPALTVRDIGWAAVSSAGTLTAGVNVSSVSFTGPNLYTITFKTTPCHYVSYLATLAADKGAAPPHGEISVSGSTLVVTVATFDSAGNPMQQAFNIEGNC